MADCHPDRKHCSKGLCRLCYQQTEYYKSVGKRWREAHKEQIKEKDKEYCILNKDKLSDSKKEYYQNNKEHIKNRINKARIKRKYGITYEEYLCMIHNQNNLCGICNTYMDSPQIDHCHTTNKVRMLLCFNCNAAIGLLKENIVILKSAIEYLERYA